MTRGADYWINGWGCTYGRFCRSELAFIIGVEAGNRSIRFPRGVVQKSEQRRQHLTAREVAAIMVRHDLMTLGIPPNYIADLPQKAASIVLWHALLDSPKTCVVTGSPASTERFVERFNRDETIADTLCGFPSVQRFIVKGAETPLRFIEELDFAIRRDTSRFGCHLDLERSGRDLGSRALRPLLMINVGAKNGKIVSRSLTGEILTHLTLVQ